MITSNIKFTFKKEDDNNDINISNKNESEDKNNITMEDKEIQVKLPKIKKEEKKEIKIEEKKETKKEIKKEEKKEENNMNNHIDEERYFIVK